MSFNATVAVDVMTAEQGLRAMLHAVVSVLRRKPDIKVHLTGNRLLIEEVLESCYKDIWRELNLEIHHTEIVILQTDDPVWALKNKNGSSTHRAVGLVESGCAQSVVSCANTGALAAISRYKLKRLPGVEKLSMLGSFPTYDDTKDVYISDVGASFDSDPEHLVAQAKMATAVLKKKGCDYNPVVGLLNMGTEEVKGNRLVKETARLMREDSAINFYGSVEGHDIFSGHVDIVICDGFVGNCLLKACEGTANYIMRTIKKSCMIGTLGKVVGGLLKGILKKQAPKLNPSLRNGGLIIGLNGVVIKSHGNADVLGIETAILAAVNATNSEYQKNISEKNIIKALKREQVTQV